MTNGFAPSKKLSLFAALLLAAFAFMLLSAGSSKAGVQPFHIDFDSSKIQLGTLGDLPIEDLGTKASIDGTIDDNGVVKIPQDGFKFPELGITDPVSVKGFMSFDGPATGTFKSTTATLGPNRARKTTSLVQVTSASN